MVNYLFISARNIKKRKLRSWLTMIGIFVGVAAVVALISLGEGLQNAVDLQFNKLGSNRLAVFPGSGQYGPAGGSLYSANLTERDIEVIRSVRGVDVASGILLRKGMIEFDKRRRPANIMGVDDDNDAQKLIDKTSFFIMYSGRQLKSHDTNKAVVGYSVWHDFFKKKIKTGDRIIVHGETFEVVGLQGRVGIVVHDEVVRIPLATARSLLEEPEELSSIFVLTKQSDGTALAPDIEEALRKHRDVKEGKEDFTVQTPEQIISSFKSILGMVTTVLTGIVAISLFVGGVGIMNTMYTSVLERNKEIGILKAIGAKNKDILLLFLTEAGLLGLIGGVSGIIAGAVLAKLVEVIALVFFNFDLLHVTINPQLVIFALLFSFIVGSFSGVLPAFQAAKLNPVEALRK